jgi:hypothetical protein
MLVHMPPEDGLHRGYESRLVPNPLKGRAVVPRWVERGDLPQPDYPTGVINWDYYDGAIVAIAIATPDEMLIQGTGVMIGPGLVLTATHTLSDHADAIESDAEQLQCIALRRDGRAERWLCCSLQFPETQSDISILNVELVTEAPEDWTCSCLPLSTRAPEIGESLSVLGFRFKASEPEGPEGTFNGACVLGTGDLYVVSGSVVAIYEQGRDRRMLPFPVFEIDCGTLGGMSGGPVLDGEGNVVGLLSAGWSDDDPPSNVAWIIHTLMFRPTLVWPEGMYATGAALLELPEDLVRIVGREHVRLDDEGTGLTYDRWS